MKRATRLLVATALVLSTVAMFAMPAAAATATPVADSGADSGTFAAISLGGLDGGVLFAQSCDGDVTDNFQTCVPYP